MRWPVLGAARAGLFTSFEQHEYGLLRRTGEHDPTVLTRCETLGDGPRGRVLDSGHAFPMSRSARLSLVVARRSGVIGDHEDVRR